MTDEGEGISLRDISRKSTVDFLLNPKEIEVGTMGLKGSDDDPIVMSGDWFAELFSDIFRLNWQRVLRPLLPAERRNPEAPEYSSRK